MPLRVVVEPPMFIKLPETPRPRREAGEESSGDKYPIHKHTTDHNPHRVREWDNAGAIHGGDGGEQRSGVNRLYIGCIEVFIGCLEAFIVLGCLAHLGP